MPCYDPSNGSNRAEEQCAAMFCAVMNELERRGMAEPIIAEASRNGKIDIVSFWAIHKDNDRARLAEKLHAFSKDEHQILLELLQGENHG